MDLVWTPRVMHGGTNKILIKIAYITHACVCEFLEGEQSDVETLVEWNMHKNLPPRKDIKTPLIKNHLSHTWYNVMCIFFCFSNVLHKHYDPYHKNVL